MVIRGSVGCELCSAAAKMVAATTGPIPYVHVDVFASAAAQPVLSWMVCCCVLDVDCRYVHGLRCCCAEHQCSFWVGHLAPPC